MAKFKTYLVRTSEIWSSAIHCRGKAVPKLTWRNSAHSGEVLEVQKIRGDKFSFAKWPGLSSLPPLPLLSPTKKKKKANCEMNAEPDEFWTTSLFLALFFIPFHSLWFFLSHENWVCSIGQNKAVLHYFDSKNIIMKWTEIRFSSVDYQEANFKWYYK